MSKKPAAALLVALLISFFAGWEIQSRSGNCGSGASVVVDGRQSALVRFCDGMISVDLARQTDRPPSIQFADVEDDGNLEVFIATQVERGGYEIAMISSTHDGHAVLTDLRVSPPSAVAPGHSFTCTDLNGDGIDELAHITYQVRKGQSIDEPLLAIEWEMRANPKAALAQSGTTVVDASTDLVSGKCHEVIDYKLRSSPE